MEAYGSLWKPIAAKTPFSESTRPPPFTYPAAFGVGAWSFSGAWSLVLGILHCPRRPTPAPISRHLPLAGIRDGALKGG